MDTNDPPGDDGLTPVVYADSEFAAQTKAALLHDAGINAFVFSSERSWLGASTSQFSRAGVPVWVAHEDLERAQQALQQNVEDSIDIDWSEVDVGEPEPESTQSLFNPRMRIILLMIGFLLILVWAILQFL